RRRDKRAAKRLLRKRLKKQTRSLGELRCPLWAYQKGHIGAALQQHAAVITSERSRADDQKPRDSPLFFPEHRRSTESASFTRAAPGLLPVGPPTLQYRTDSGRALAVVAVWCASASSRSPSSPRMAS